MLLATASHAGATAICEQLRAQLTDSAVANGNSDDVRKYANAISLQNSEIRKSQSDLRRLGCSSGSITVIGGQNADSCNTISAALDRMEKNKAILTQKRNSLQMDGGTSNRQRLFAAIENNGCNGSIIDQQQASVDTQTESVRPVTSFGAVSRDPFNHDGEPGINPVIDPQALNGQTQGGTLRTVCVRTCDGAFFPISAHSSPSSFQHDANVCSSMCSNTDTELYYHTMETQETADMVSAVTGKTYSELPAAFSYRNRPVGQKSTCGCQFSSYYQQVQQSRKPATVSVPDTYASVTTIASDASTASAKTKTVAPFNAGDSIPQIAERAYDPAAANIRRIGPVFLADGSSHIELKAPLGPSVQPLQ